MSTERGLRKRASYVQCFQGLVGAAVGSCSLMKKRLRQGGDRPECASPCGAGGEDLQSRLGSMTNLGGGREG